MGSAVLIQEAKIVDALAGLNRVGRALHAYDAINCKEETMGKYFLFFVLFLGSLDCFAAPAILDSVNLALLQAGGKQNLDDKIKAIVAEVKAYASKFNISREKAKADKNFVLEERKGISYFVTIVREDYSGPQKSDNSVRW